MHTILMDFVYLLIIPDLNPVDYKIWSVVQQRVYQSRVHNVDELKQFLVHVWHVIDQTIVDSAIDEWHGRLRAQALIQREAYHSAV